MTFIQLRATLLGRWRAVFKAYGIDVPDSPNRHAPCPACGGTDRFRFADANKRGELDGRWYCSQCPKKQGDGFDLFCAALRLNAREALNELSNFVSGQPSILSAPVPKPVPKKSPAEQQAEFQMRLDQVIPHLSRNASVYLRRKGFGEVICRVLDCDLKIGKQWFRKDDTVIPLRNIKGQVVGIQFIRAKKPAFDSKKAKDKFYLAGSQKFGSFYALGALPAERVVLCEGVATGYALKRIVKHVTVVICFDAGNIPTVLHALQDKWPDSHYCVAADNDESGTGQRVAEKCLERPNVKMAIPQTVGDWDDVRREKGEGAARREFAEQMTEKSPA